MIEAVNASIATSQIVKAVAEESSSSTSLAANPSRIQKAAIGTPYLSMQVKIAPKTKPIFVVRDTQTGNAIKQFPTEAQIKAYQKAVEVRAEAQAQSSVKTSGSGDSTEISTEAAKAIVESSVEFKEERKAVTKTEVSMPGAPTGSGSQTGKTSFSTDA